MLVITKPNRVPHGGYWRYQAGGKVLMHPYINVLQDQVLKYTKANNLPFDLTEFVQNVCRTTEAASGVTLCHDADERSPSVASIVTGFIQSMSDWARSGFSMTSKEILQARLSKCSGCDQWRGSSGGTLMNGSCKLCGCRGIKLALATSKCPKGWWILMVASSLYHLNNLFHSTSAIHGFC